MSALGLRVDRHVRDEAAVARPALRKALERRAEQPLLLAGRANPLQVQVRRRVPRRREHEGGWRLATRPASTRRSRRTSLWSRCRARGRGARFQASRSNRSTAACRPSDDSATFMYAAGGPNVPAAVPSRRNHVGCVMFRSPVQYTSVPLAETANAAPSPNVSTPSATRIGSPVSRDASGRAAGPSACGRA